MTNRQLRRHIRKIRFNRLIGLLALMVAVICFLLAHAVAEHYYAQWTNSDAKTQKEQIQTLEKAIDLYPSRNTAYLKILDIYLADGLLSETEEAHIHLLLNGHQDDLNKESESSAELYRQVATSYICCFDAPVETRLEKAYQHFILTKPYQKATELERTMINAYIKVGAYFDEYIWLTGSIKKPPATEVSDMLRLSGAVLDALKEHPREQLAYACCVKQLLRHHGTMWEELVGQPAVENLRQQINSISLKNSKDPATIRLYRELRSTEEEDENAS